MAEMQRDSHSSCAAGAQASHTRPQPPINNVPDWRRDLSCNVPDSQVLLTLSHAWENRRRAWPCPNNANLLSVAPPPSSSVKRQSGHCDFQPPTSPCVPPSIAPRSVAGAPPSPNFRRNPACLAPRRFARIANKARCCLFFEQAPMPCAVILF